MTYVTHGLDRYTCSNNEVRHWCDLHMSCDLQAVFIPAQQTCREVFTVLLIIKYSSTSASSEMTADLKLMLVQLLDLLLKHQTTMTFTRYHHLTSLRDGASASYIYIIGPTLKDVGLKPSLNTYKDIVEMLFFELRSIPYLHRDLIMCYKGDRYITQNYYSVFHVSDEELNSVFDLCETVILGENIVGSAEKILTPQLTRYVPTVVAGYRMFRFNLHQEAQQL